MKRAIGSFALLMMSVGGIVGSGWLFGPLYAAKAAGPSAILAWVIGGALMMVVALTFAELSTMFPVAGGMVRFAEITHGSLVGFALGWIAWLAAVSVAPIETMAMIQYASNYLPGIMHRVDGTPVLTNLGMLTAAAILFFICLLNKIGIKFISKTNVGIVLLKLAVPVFTLIVLFSVDFHASNLHHFGFMTTGWQGILSSLPTAGIIFSFIGFSPAIQLAGESKNPNRAIPLAILGSLSLCVILYVLLQIAFVGALKPEQLAHGWTHLSFSGDAGPFAGIAASLGLTGFMYILYADAAVSPLGTSFIYTTATARINYAMSENNYMPPILKKLNNKSVPMNAIWANFIIGLLLFLPFPAWQSMMSFLVSAFVFIYAVGPIALLSLRKSHPQQTRPFRLPCAKIITVLAFYICNLIIYWTGWNILYKVMIAIIIGLLYLCFYKLTRSGRHLKIDWRQGQWLAPYFIGMGVISFFGDFGGGDNTIPFGWDFLIIALFSCVIFYWALRSAKR